MALSSADNVVAHQIVMREREGAVLGKGGEEAAEGEGESQEEVEKEQGEASGERESGATGSHSAPQWDDVRPFVDAFLATSYRSLRSR